MRPDNPTILATIERRVDNEGYGSIWRACLAIKRSCPNPNLGNLALELGYGYCIGRNTLKHLKNICKDYLNDSEGEFHEAVQSLQNAIDLLPTGITEREDLWERLNRLVS